MDVRGHSFPSLSPFIAQIYCIIETAAGCVESLHLYHTPKPKSLTPRRRPAHHHLLERRAPTHRQPRTSLKVNNRAEALEAARRKEEFEKEETLQRATRHFSDARRAISTRVVCHFLLPLLINMRRSSASSPFAFLQSSHMCHGVPMMIVAPAADQRLRCTEHA